MMLIRSHRPGSKIIVEGALAARLVLARYYAGLNARGAKVAAADSRYRAYLNAALAKARGLSALNRDAVLSYSIAVWRSAESGKKIEWASCPVSVRQTGENPISLAVLERAALDDWKSSKEDAAIAKLTRVSSAFAEVRAPPTLICASSP